MEKRRSWWELQTWMPSSPRAQLLMSMLRRKRQLSIRASGIFPCCRSSSRQTSARYWKAEDKLSIVIEFVVGSDGSVHSSSVYRAIIRNKAQLTYNAVGAWLENKSGAPDKVAASTDLQSQLKLQDEVAQALKNERYRHGALNIETIEVRPVVLNDKVVDVVKQEKNRATELIEDFMIAANEVVARMLETNKVSSIRRVVKTPERWGRIVELAAKQGEQLPADAGFQSSQ